MYSKGKTSSQVNRYVIHGLIQLPAGLIFLVLTIPRQNTVY
jgi:hypothetical protein